MHRSGRRKKMDTRTNFVKLEHLPPCYSNGQELFNRLDPCGDILEITATDPTSVVVTYMRRTSARNCVFALDGQHVFGSQIRASFFYPKDDPAYSTCPILQSLGKNVGVNSFNYDVRSFKPWSSMWTAQRTGGQGIGTTGSSRTTIGGKFATVLTNYTYPWTLPRDTSDIEDCPICLVQLGEKATYNINSDSSRALVLNKCKHAYHQSCLESMLTLSTSPFLQCPTCKLVYGARIGTMPTTGSISHQILNQSLAGHPNTRTLEVTFQFPGGVQGPEHPHPGRRYNVVGFPRKAYLPETTEGELALHGIYQAWAQRVLFTVGPSQTTGMDDCVTWNDIHLKTELTGGQHGYPDPLHLTNLLQELKGFGITEATISNHMARYPALKTTGRL